MDKNKEIPAPIVSEQVGRDFSQLTQNIFKLKEFFAESEVAVKPVNLSDLYGYTNAKN